MARGDENDRPYEETKTQQLKTWCTQWIIQIILFSKP